MDVTNLFGIGDRFWVMFELGLYLVFLGWITFTALRKKGVSLYADLWMLALGNLVIATWVLQELLEASQGVSLVAALTRASVMVFFLLHIPPWTFIKITKGEPGFQWEGPYYWRSLILLLILPIPICLFGLATAPSPILPPWVVLWFVGFVALLWALALAIAKLGPSREKRASRGNSP